MTTKTRHLAAALGLTLLGVAATVQPAAAFFGSFAATCRDINVYGGGSFMTAWCQRLDGSWHFSRIANCGGYGVHNDNGYLRCGT